MEVLLGYVFQKPDALFHYICHPQNHLIKTISEALLKKTKHKANINLGFEKRNGIGLKVEIKGESGSL